MQSLKLFWQKSREEVLSGWKIWTILRSFYGECALFSVSKNFLLNGALKKKISPQWILGDSFWQEGTFPREVANINILLCMLFWAPSTAPSPPFSNNLVVTGFASCWHPGCCGWPGGSVGWKLLSKIRLSLVNKSCMSTRNIWNLLSCFPLLRGGKCNTAEIDFRSLEWKKMKKQWAFAQSVPVCNNLSSAWWFLKNICEYFLSL